MRLLHRNETDPHDERVHDPDTARTPDEPRERSSWRSMFQRTDDPDDDGAPRRSIFHRGEPTTEPAAGERGTTDRDRTAVARDRRDRRRVRARTSRGRARP